MRIETTRFGVVEIDDNALLTMPNGLMGIENMTEYCLIQHQTTAKLQILT